MERYYQNDDIGTRSQKNENLYKKVHDSEISDFSVNSNESILGENSKNIDVDNLRQILDKKYRETPRRSSIAKDIKNQVFQSEEIKDEDKDYDINVILEKARNEKTTDYTEERLKKVRDTQFDILNGLNLNNDEEKMPNNDEENLMNLINTITTNELINEKNANDPLDLLKDLKGNDDTKVLPSNEITKTLEVKDKNDIKKIEKENNVTQQEKNNNPKDLENSFFTNSIKISKRDFEDFEDFEKNVDGKNGLKIFLIIILILILLIGSFLIVNKIFNLGIFEKIIRIVKK